MPLLIRNDLPTNNPVSREGQAKAGVDRVRLPFRVRTLFARDLRVTKRRHLLFSEEIATGRSAAVPDPSTSEASQQTERDVRHLYECIQRLPDLDKTLIKNGNGQTLSDRNGLPCEN